MTYDHYKENLKHGKPVPQAAAPAPEVTEEAPPEQKALTPDPTAAKPDGHLVATPTRPINLPVLPGYNKGYNIRVESTEDDNPLNYSKAQITDLETSPDIHLNSQNWQNAAEAASHYANSSDDEDSAKGDRPLNIRMSFLPDSKVSPVPSARKPPYNKRHPLEQLTAREQSKATEQKKTTDLASCAAVDAYKKRQMEAIESDRKTLEALQSVISQLGLQQQLNFMTDVSGRINTPSQAGEDAAVQGSRADAPSAN